MPVYEYVCEKNDHRFEVRQSFSDDALTDCQMCDSSVRKVYSAAGIVFKGSGYYVNDSRSSTVHKTNRSDSPPKSADKAAGSGASSSTDNGASSTDSSASSSSTGTSSSGSGSSASTSTTSTSD